jgi:hypothetical protein
MPELMTKGCWMFSGSSGIKLADDNLAPEKNYPAKDIRKRSQKRSGRH